jgi:hypothetical protein
MLTLYFFEAAIQFAHKRESHWTNNRVVGKVQRRGDSAKPLVRDTDLTLAEVIVTGLVPFDREASCCEGWPQTQADHAGVMAAWSVAKRTVATKSSRV